MEQTTTTHRIMRRALAVVVTASFGLAGAGAIASTEEQRPPLFAPRPELLAPTRCAVRSMRAAEPLVSSRRSAGRMSRFERAAPDVRRLEDLRRAAAEWAPSARRDHRAGHAGTVDCDESHYLPWAWRIPTTTIRDALLP